MFVDLHFLKNIDLCRKENFALENIILIFIAIVCALSGPEKVRLGHKKKAIYTSLYDLI